MVLLPLGNLPDSQNVCFDIAKIQQIFTRAAKFLKKNLNIYIVNYSGNFSGLDSLLVFQNGNAINSQITQFQSARTHKSLIKHLGAFQDYWTTIFLVVFTPILTI